MGWLNLILRRMSIGSQFFGGMAGGRKQGEDQHPEEAKFFHAGR
jgi:hypothetical protein